MAFSVIANTCDNFEFPFNDLAPGFVVMTSIFKSLTILLCPHFWFLLYCIQYILYFQQILFWIIYIIVK